MKLSELKIDAKWHVLFKYVKQCEPNLIHINDNNAFTENFLLSSIKQYNYITQIFSIIWKQEYFQVSTEILTHLLPVSFLHLWEESEIGWILAKVIVIFIINNNCLFKNIWWAYPELISDDRCW